MTVRCYAKLRFNDDRLEDCGDTDENLRVAELNSCVWLTKCLEQAYRVNYNITCIVSISFVLFDLIRRCASLPAQTPTASQPIVIVGTLVNVMTHDVRTTVRTSEYSRSYF